MASRAKRKGSFHDGVTQPERRRLARLAALVPNQDVLNSILLDVANPMQRGAVYDEIKKHLKFESAYPDWVARFNPKADGGIGGF